MTRFYVVFVVANEDHEPEFTVDAPSMLEACRLAVGMSGWKATDFDADDMFAVSEQHMPVLEDSLPDLTYVPIEHVIDHPDRQPGVIPHMRRISRVFG